MLIVFIPPAFKVTLMLSMMAEVSGVIVCTFVAVNIAKNRHSASGVAGCEKASRKGKILINYKWLKISREKYY
jgi:hypothetical protein